MTTPTDQPSTGSQALLDQLVAEGHDPDLVTAEIEHLAAAGVVQRPADPTAEDLVLDEKQAAWVRERVQAETAIRSAPTPPACPSWCGLEPGHGFVDTLTETGRPFRSHVLETSRGDESVDLLVDETVGVDGSVTRSAAPYLVVWVGGNPVEQHLTGPEVLALVERLSAAASVAVSAWLVAAVSEYDQAVDA